jgi:hypothetical protein
MKSKCPYYTIKLTSHDETCEGLRYFVVPAILVSILVNFDNMPIENDARKCSTRLATGP